MLDFVMRNVELAGDGIEWTASRRLKDLAFADDISLLGLVEGIVLEASKFGHTVNIRKTETMSGRTNDYSQVTIENEPIQEVEKFVYLKWEFTKDGDIRKEVGIKIDKAGAAFRIMVKVLNEDGTSLRTKLKLLTSIVLCVMLFGCETWK